MLKSLIELMQDKICPRSPSENYVNARRNVDILHLFGSLELLNEIDNDVTEQILTHFAVERYNTSTSQTFLNNQNNEPFSVYFYTGHRMIHSDSVFS